VPGAAFFDLDRTLLLGASGPVVNDALREVGLAPPIRLPGERVLFRAYDLLGETLPSMALARVAAFVAAGWPAAAARRAGELAAERLEGLMAPYAKVLLEEHRAARTPVVLATTTPYDLVAAFADRLGFDDVIATRYAVGPDGRYTGRLASEFVWGFGKLRAVRRWAEGRGVSLRDCAAYSDSVYDAPLLSAVGRPHATNPDPRLALVALTRRWPVLHLDAPPGVPKCAGVEPFDVLAALARPELLAPFARFDLGCTDGIPRRGPAILAANHRSYFDVVAIGLVVARAGRPVRFLGKKEVFDAPLVGSVARALGGIRVDRGSGSEEPLREAARALRAGELVAVLPQGTIPRGRAFFSPVLTGRPGAARLAAATGAPVVPIGVWGTEAVWPRSSRLPRVCVPGRAPWVRVRVGEPFRPPGRDPVADTEAIMEAIASLLPPEAHVAREPSLEELLATVPPGMRLEDVEPLAGTGGDGDGRRPGPVEKAAGARRPGGPLPGRRGGR
jgi:putative phosphoserine phosphatase/1-acylglycerol-3-phosphate O-acyltransferase